MLGGDITEAHQHLNRALRLQPSNALALGTLAKLKHTVTNDFQDAENLFVQVPFHTILEVVYFTFSNPMKFVQALSIDPTNVDVLVSYSYFLRTVRRDIDGAIECLLVGFPCSARLDTDTHTSYIKNLRFKCALLLHGCLQSACSVNPFNIRAQLGYLVFSSVFLLTPVKTSHALALREGECSGRSWSL